MADLRYLLLQIRDADDPIGPQEVGCFARAIGCQSEQITPLDLLSRVPSETDLGEVDAVLIGGSGDYSAASESPWLEEVLAGLRTIHQLGKPTFASCWGFQAFARALGGRCIHDPARAELGTLELQLTEEGLRDPLFGDLGPNFLGQAGHEDHVVELPPTAVLLASTDLVTNQAFKFSDAPIYCTQFHPELDRQTLIDRISKYPRYVEQIVGTTVEKFAQHCRDTPETRKILKRFAHFVHQHI